MNPGHYSSLGTYALHQESGKNHRSSPTWEEGSARSDIRIAGTIENLFVEFAFSSKRAVNCNLVIAVANLLKSRTF